MSELPPSPPESNDEEAAAARKRAIRLVETQLQTLRSERRPRPHNRTRRWFVLLALLALFTLAWPLLFGERRPVREYRQPAPGGYIYGHPGNPDVVQSVEPDVVP